MGFFTVKTDEETVRDYSGDGGAYISKSGIYDIVIKSVIVDKTQNGSEFLNLWFEHQGQEQIIFQAMRLTNNDGSANLGAKLFNKLCVIADFGEGTEIQDPTPRMLPIGKGGEEKECMVLTEFDDMPVKIRVQFEYRIYEGKIQESKIVRNFFRFTDNATASEIVNNSEEMGKQYSKEEEIADKISYKDGLTEEEVSQWLKDRRSGKKEAEKKPSGTGRRSFGRKA